MQGITWLGVDLGPSIGGRGQHCPSARRSLKGQVGLAKSLAVSISLVTSLFTVTASPFSTEKGLVGGGGGNFTIVNAIHARQSGPALSNGIVMKSFRSVDSVTFTNSQQASELAL